MQAERAQLAARTRTLKGKRARFLRRAGFTPANIYGPGSPSLAVEIPTRELERHLGHVPRGALVSLGIEGQGDVTVLVRKVARKPTTDELYHVDLYRVSMTHTLRTEVPVVFTGEAPAVRSANATILRGIDALHIECLPVDLPEKVTVDIEQLTEIGSAIHVRDLALPPRVNCLTDPDEIVVHAVAPRLEIEEVVEEEEGAALAPAPAAAEAEPERGEEKEA
ncbi:MAG: 50S ribosomal protein L25 [Chloroflexi bacterium]|nr:50S ribosomal protein L25 [Chloroflexota bacterium]